MIKKAKKVFEIALHIMLWGLLVYVLFQALGIKTYKLRVNGEAQFLQVYYYSMFLFIGIDVLLKISLFYSSAYLTIPTYLIKKERQHVLRILGVFILSLSMSALAEYLIYQSEGVDFYSRPLTLFAYSTSLHILILALAFCYRIVKNWAHQEEQKRYIESERLKTEISFLKSQINPHFLFNVLNNLYAEARQYDNKTVANGIAKLSYIMRYMIHDSNVEFIGFDKELQYLKSYIELQRLRIVETDPFEFKLEVNDAASNVLVAPILFVPFVENAFKHGFAPEEPSFIHIFIDIEGDELQFKVVNSKFKKSEQQFSHSGIGLTNIKRRLALLYPNKHDLSIVEGDNSYEVLLKIKTGE